MLDGKGVSEALNNNVKGLLPQFSVWFRSACGGA